jgi:hypothetical protein
MTQVSEPIRIDRFKCVMGTWTYVVVYSRSCVLGYFKSRKAARVFADDYATSLERLVSGTVK